MVRPLMFSSAALRDITTRYTSHTPAQPAGSFTLKSRPSALSSSKMVEVAAYSSPPVFRTPRVSPRGTASTHRPQTCDWGGSSRHSHAHAAQTSIACRCAAALKTGHLASEARPLQSTPLRSPSHAGLYWVCCAIFRGPMQHFVPLACMAVRARMGFPPQAIRRASCALAACLPPDPMHCALLGVLSNNLHCLARAAQSTRRECRRWCREPAQVPCSAPEPALVAPPHCPRAGRCQQPRQHKPATRNHLPLAPNRAATIRATSSKPIAPGTTPAHAHSLALQVSSTAHLRPFRTCHPQES